MSPEQPSAALRPCPFCGETPDLSVPTTLRMTQGDKWGVVACCCEGPEVRTGYARDGSWHAAAIEAWNTRATDSLLREALEVLEQARIKESYDNGVLTYLVDLGAGFMPGALALLPRLRELLTEEEK